MNNIKTQTTPAAPNLFRTLVAGFDTITNHISLILFPIGLDLLIWLAPRLSIEKLLTRLVNDFVAQSQAMSQDSQAVDMLFSAQELWKFAAEHFNLATFLRSYPVGIPSLMVSLLPIETPLGITSAIDVNSFWMIAGYAVVLTIVGLAIGAFYFSLIAQAAILGEIRWRKSLADWPWLSLQVIMLALVWFVLFIGVTVPASCAISIASISNMAFGQCAVMLYGGFLIWLIFPLLFSPHGILVNQLKVWPSIKRGLHITRMTLPTISLFIMTILILSQALDFLWRIPPENSWLMLIGIAGHAFVTTGFLSASFIYYNDADLWIRSIQEQDTEEKSSSHLVS